MAINRNQVSVHFQMISIARCGHLIGAQSRSTTINPILGAVSGRRSPTWELE